MGRSPPANPPFQLGRTALRVAKTSTQKWTGNGTLRTVFRVDSDDLFANGSPWSAGNAGWHPRELQFADDQWLDQQQTHTVAWRVVKWQLRSYVECGLGARTWLLAGVYSRPSKDASRP